MFDAIKSVDKKESPGFDMIKVLQSDSDFQFARIARQVYILESDHMRDAI